VTVTKRVANDIPAAKLPAPSAEERTRRTELILEDLERAAQIARFSARQATDARNDLPEEVWKVERALRSRSRMGELDKLTRNEQKELVRLKGDLERAERHAEETGKAVQSASRVRQPAKEAFDLWISKHPQLRRPIMSTIGEGGIPLRDDQRPWSTKR
jgi:hypothetical protein